MSQVVHLDSYDDNYETVDEINEENNRSIMEALAINNVQNEEIAETPKGNTIDNELNNSNSDVIVSSEIILEGNMHIRVVSVFFTLKFKTLRV